MVPARPATQTGGATRSAHADRSREEDAVDITRTTVPGTGTIHQFAAGDGRRLAVVVGPDERRHLVVYEDGDEPAAAVDLAPDEADQLAQVLLARPLAERIAVLERRMTELRGESR